MTRARLLSLALASVVVTAVAQSASAQVRHRRPYAESYRLNYGFDNNGSASGCRDYNCGSACYDGHGGSDFGTPLGTNVLASQAGRVVATNNGCADYGGLGNTCGGRCGNYVQIEHSDGSRTLYCHMQRNSITVSVGQTVTCGQRIGRSASSGNSSGPHLHFGYRRTASAAYRDSYNGSCATAATIWVSQGAYRDPPGTSCGSTCTPSAESCNGRDDDCDGRVDENVTRSCSTACGSGTQTCSSGSWGTCSARTPTTEVCNGRDDDCDGTVDDGDVCEVDLLNAQPTIYAAPRTTDIDADGRADLCARGFGGVRCWRSSPTGWSAPTEAVPWSNSLGWTDVTNYATVRMGDIDGDGRADVCARSNTAVVCATSTGTGFTAASTWRDGLSDANNWNQPRYYTTIRLADVNGDGKDDLCARDPEGFGCWLSNGTRFDRRIDGPRWADSVGWGGARFYGTIRMGDVNGDGLADVCARAAAGIRCALSDGNGFPTSVTGPEWSDAAGWSAMSQWSTIRLLDFDGDGRADICGRSSTDLLCARSLGTSFAAPITVAALSDASGWADISNYATLRTGDLNGDGAEDLCIRANAGMRCWVWTGSEFAGVSGPAWSDEVGWNAPAHYHTVRMADFDGDGLEDLCARAGAGWRCHPSRGDGFGSAVTFDELTNDGGWTEPHYYTTIMIAGRACRAEMEVCNGRDDDCDGEVDEHARAELCNDTDDDCDGAIDEGDVCAVEPTDGGVSVPADGSMVTSDGGGVDAGAGGAGGGVVGGCACRASGTGGSAGLGGLALAIVLGAITARRRRHARAARR